MEIDSEKSYDHFRHLTTGMDSEELVVKYRIHQSLEEVMLSVVPQGGELKKWEDDEKHKDFMMNQINKIFDNVREERIMLVNENVSMQNACEAIGFKPGWDLPWSKETCGCVGVLYKKFVGKRYRATLVEFEWGFSNDEVKVLSQLLLEILEQCQRLASKRSDTMHEAFYLLDMFMEVENAKNRTGRHLRQIREMCRVDLLTPSLTTQLPAPHNIPLGICLGRALSLSRASQPVEGKVLPYKTGRFKMQWVPVEQDICECEIIYLHIWKWMEQYTRIKQAYDEFSMREAYLNHIYFEELFIRRIKEVQKDELLDLSEKMDRFTIGIENMENKMKTIAVHISHQTAVVAWRRWEAAHEHMSVVMEQYESSERESQRVNEELQSAGDACDRERDTDDYARVTDLFRVAWDRSLEAAAAYTSSQSSRVRALKYIADTERQLEAGV
jgi:hypothetical protein